LLYRLLHLVGRKDALRHFPQLKTRSKWEDLDRIWAKICEYDWEHWPLEPVAEGASPWLEIETDEAFWAHCLKQQIMASWASFQKRSQPKKPKAHSYANRQILFSMKRVSSHHEGLRITKEPSKKRPPRRSAAVCRAIRARHRY
jgi:hypothetical protein